MAYPVVDEWVDGFTTDLFHPKDPAFIDAFSEQELRDLCELYGLLCHAAKILRDQDQSDIPTILKIAEWRWVMAKAQVMLIWFRND
ncbi:MAG: hypothetical protein QM811_02530 [Pirellulales bacterium]